MDKNLTKEEFNVMLMLYVANSDGRVNPDEMRLMLEQTTPAVYVEVKRRFAKMNDAEVLQCIEENKQTHAANTADRQQLLSELKSLIEADGKPLPMEEVMLKGIEELLG